MKPQPFPPRFIRYAHAPAYLGMSREVFNAEVRPYVLEIPIGRIGVAFDRLDLDAWADEYKRTHGRVWVGAEGKWKQRERLQVLPSGRRRKSSMKADPPNGNEPDMAPPRQRNRKGKATAQDRIKGTIELCRQIAREPQADDVEEEFGPTA